MGLFTIYEEGRWLEVERGMPRAHLLRDISSPSPSLLWRKEPGGVGMQRWQGESEPSETPYLSLSAAQPEKKMGQRMKRRCNEGSFLKTCGV